MVTAEGDIEITVRRGQRSEEEEERGGGEGTETKTKSTTTITSADDVREDPVQLSIFSHRFMGIAEQMGRTLARTAISVNIKER